MKISKNKKSNKKSAYYSRKCQKIRKIPDILFLLFLLNHLKLLHLTPALLYYPVKKNNKDNPKEKPDIPFTDKPFEERRF